VEIAADRHVTLRYALAVDGEGAPDADNGGQDTAFIHGRGQVLPGIENRLTGRKAGERLHFALPPAEGFGEHDPNLELELPISEFPEEVRDRLVAGQRFRGPHPSDGSAVLYVVQERRDDRILASGNHPLAGKTLHLDVAILAVREATEDELSGGGGCCGGGGCGSGGCGDGSCGDGGCGEHEHGHDHGHSHGGGGCGSGGCGCH
jgi:FKBP-type peptidyl-prolyl cis-trans isomerase SlyD